MDFFCSYWVCCVLTLYHFGCIQWLISYRPGQVNLYGTWNQVSQFSYQDSVGQGIHISFVYNCILIEWWIAICEIAETIPYGVLCFVPSYQTMDKLIDRWRVGRWGHANLELGLSKHPLLLLDYWHLRAHGETQTYHLWYGSFWCDWRANDTNGMIHFRTSWTREQESIWDAA